jgi:Protein of unknown function (DUF3300)
MSDFFRSLRTQFTAVICSALLVPGGLLPVGTVRAVQQSGGTEEQAPKIPNDQLDSLVAPIALYPDPLLAQVLAASTYPLEIMQLQQWLTKNKGLKDKALQDAVMKQPWDPTVQALAALPDVVKRLSDDVQWTTDLGNAVLAQQSDVMDAVQRMRAKAQGKGNLKSNDEMKVETKVVESKQVIVVEQAKPDVVYVPSYEPTVVYGPPAYPYPPITYPPPGYYAAGMAISFGVGMAMGAAWGGGGWCCNSGWGSNNSININNNNTFVNNSNRQNNISNRSGNRTGSNSWQHNTQHRGGTPYSNRATANRYGGTARGDSVGSRQVNARQNQGQLGGRGQGAQNGSVDRGSRQQTGANNRGTSGGNGLGGNRSAAAGGSADRIGNRSVPSGGGTKGGGAFGGGSGGQSGDRARTSSTRGTSSMGSRGGRGGGGRRR